MKKPPRAAALRLDPKNANAGTARGRAALAASVGTFGYGRPILSDRRLTVVAGNKTAQTAQANGAEMAVVPIVGDELLVHQRLDLDMTLPKAQALAVVDNQVGLLDLDWAVAQVQADLLAGVDLSVAFRDDELLAFQPETAHGQAVLDVPVENTTTLPADTGGPPAFTEEPPDVPAPPQMRYTVELTFDSVPQRLRWFSLLRLLQHQDDATRLAGSRLVQYVNTLTPLR